MSTGFVVVFALYPNVTQLDFTAPAEVFARLPDARIVLASLSGGELGADCGGVTFAGLQRLADVRQCDLLCVPGGSGTVTAMEDPEYLGALRRLAAQARYVTSVCTGSLLLGAAGLLRGRRAACHWAWSDLLGVFGAIPAQQRVVRDGPVITGGGVTAGIDLALTVLAEIAGERYAQTVQLALEYAPAPPFDAGAPERVHPQILADARARLAALAGDWQAPAARAAAALERAG